MLQSSFAFCGRRHLISDSRGLIGDIGLPLVRVGRGEYGYMPVYSRLAATTSWLRSPSDWRSTAAGLRRPSPLYGDDGTDLHEGATRADPVPGDPPNIWSLNAVDPAATNRPGEETRSRSSGISRCRRPYAYGNIGETYCPGSEPLTASWNQPWRRWEERVLF